ncbi:MAG TPA: arsinothricin resistance N-acetyltransferase ArsN1 family B [Vicinamibacterales bacterium]|nr:arsinothricin resistance N-acetyltransferase ArsN1 family B [Vicinamibacterales bacterium]
MAVQIRLATHDDGAAVGAIYRPVVAETAISFETTLPDGDEMARRIDETLRSYPWLVCDVDGHTAGYAYAAKHRVRGAYQWSVDTSVYIAEAHRRRNIGRGLYASLFAILAAQGYFNAFAGIALPNPASVALHEAMSFEPIGVYRRVGYKLDRWHDVGWWQLILRQHEGSPAAPLDLATLCDRPDWTQLLTRGESIIRSEAA